MVVIPNRRFAEHLSLGVDVEESFDERLWGLLRQVVSDPAGDGPVHVLAGELLLIGAGIGMGRTVGVTFEGDRRHGDGRAAGERPLEIVVSWLALGQAEPPAVVVNHDVDVVRVVEGCGATVERRLVEVPLGRGRLPDEPGEFASMFVVAGPATFGGEVELVPPGQLRRRWQWRLVSGLAADQVAPGPYTGRARVRRRRWRCVPPSRTRR
jgi:hypothetical protein